MCFGEEHSWITLIFGSVFIGLSIYGYGRKSLDNLVICLMLGLVVLMQLWEALAWRGFCRLASWGAYLTIILQVSPVILLLPSMLGNLRGKIALGLLILYYIVVLMDAKTPRCILADKIQIRYTWFDKWPQQLAYFAVMSIAPLLLMKDTKLAIFWAIAFFSALIVTNFVYGHLETNGSIWCYYGALCSIILFIYFMIMEDDKK